MFSLTIRSGVSAPPSTGLDSPPSVTDLGTSDSSHVLERGMILAACSCSFPVLFPAYRVEHAAVAAVTSIGDLGGCDLGTMSYLSFDFQSTKLQRCVHLLPVAGIV